MSFLNTDSSNTNVASQEFQEQLNALTQSNKSGKFKGFLCVEEREGKVTLVTVGLWRVFLEKLAGAFGWLLGTRNLTNEFLIEAVALNFLEKNQQWINETNIQKVHALAQRTGLISTNDDSRHTHSQLNLLIENVTTQKINSVSTSFFLEFRDSHQKELAPFQTLLKKIQPKNPEDPSPISLDLAKGLLTASGGNAASQPDILAQEENVSTEIVDKPEPANGKLSDPQSKVTPGGVPEHTVDLLTERDKQQATWGKTAVKVAGAVLGIAGMAMGAWALYRAFSLPGTQSNLTPPPDSVDQQLTLASHTVNQLSPIALAPLVPAFLEKAMDSICLTNENICPVDELPSDEGFTELLADPLPDTQFPPSLLPEELESHDSLFHLSPPLQAPSPSPPSSFSEPTLSAESAASLFPLSPPLQAPSSSSTPSTFTPTQQPETTSKPILTQASTISNWIMATGGLLFTATSIGIGKLISKKIALARSHSRVIPQRSPSSSANRSPPIHSPPTLSSIPASSGAVSSAASSPDSQQIPIPCKPPLTPPPPWQAFQPAQYASNLFALMNLDFMGLDTKEVGGNATISLPFIIQQLGEALNDPKISPPEKEKIQKLMRSYEFTYATAHWQQELVKQKDPQTILNYKKAIKASVLAELAVRKHAVISTGYSAHPAGHEVALELFLDKNNEVTGHVVNRGAGVERHMFHVAGNKKKRDTAITLTGAPFSILEDSSFLEDMLDLTFLIAPSKETLPYVHHNTFYDISDFYEVLLPSWPGGTITYSNREPRTPQRGPTCYGKTHWTRMKEMLADGEGEVSHGRGKDLADYLKIKMKASSIQLYVENEPVTLQNKNEILDSSAKLVRSVIKPKSASNSFIDNELVKTLTQYSTNIKDTVLETVKSIKRTMSQQNLNFVPVEPDVYALDITPGDAFTVDGDVNLKEKKYSFPDLSNCKMEDLKIFLNQSCQTIQELFQKKNMWDGLQYAIRVLMSLPPCNSEIWKTLATEDLEKIINIQTLLVDLQRLKFNNTPRVITTPDEACLHLKCLAITLQAHSLDPADPLSPSKLNPNLVKFTLRRVPTYFRKQKSENPLYHAPSSMKLAQEVARAYSVINTYFRDYPTANSFFSDEKVIYQSARLLECYDVEEFSSLEECRGHTEFQYLKGHIEQELPDKQLIEKTLALTCNWDSPMRGLNGADLPGSATLDPDFSLIKRQYLLLFSTLFFQGIKAGKENFSSGEMQLPDLKRATVLPGTIFESKKNKLLKLAPSQACAEFEEQRLKELLNPEHTSLQNAAPMQSIGLAKVISSEEKAALLSVHCKEELSIPQFIHYFEQYPHRLKERLFRAFFRHALFQIDGDTGISPIQICLQDALSRRQLFRFLNSATAQAVHTKTFGVQCFLLKMRIQALVFLADVEGIESDPYQQELGSVKKEILRLLKTTKDPSDRSQLAHTLVASYPCVKESQAVKTALAPFCMQAYQEIHQAGYQYSFEASPLNTEHDLSFQFQEDIEKGKFDLKNESDAHLSVLLPEKITNDSDYRKFFTTSYQAEQISQKLYEFSDERGQIYRAQIQEGGDISLYIKKNNDWYEYTSDPGKIPDDIGHPLGDLGYLKGNNTYWNKVGCHEAILLSKDRQTIVATLTPQAIKKGTGLENPPLLLAVNYKANSLIHHLSRLIERKTMEILLWKQEDGDLCLCEIPSLNLSFHKEVTDTGEVRWICASYPGYFLDTQQECPAFYPCPHYVLLKNDQGQQMAIMKAYPFDREKPKFGSPNPLPVSSLGAIDKIFSYSLNANGAIQLPHDEERLLYLIYLALAKRDYSIALQALTELKKHPKIWSKGAEKVLEYLKTDWGNRKTIDTHPHAISIRIQVALLVTQSFKTKQSIKGLNLDYPLYLDQLNNMGSRFTLTEEEEKACIQLIGGGECGMLRGEKLMGYPHNLNRRIVHEKPQDPMIINHYSFNWISSEIQKKMLSHVGSPVLLPMKMRLTSDFVCNFLHYYHVMKLGDVKAREDLLRLLQLGRYTPIQAIQSLSKFLINMSEKPSMFPPFKEILDSAKAGKLNEQLEKIALSFPQEKVFKFPKEWTFGHRFSDKGIRPKILENEVLTATVPKKIKKVSNQPQVDLVQGTVLDDILFCDVPNQIILEEIESKKAAIAELKRIFTRQPLKAERDEATEPCIMSTYQQQMSGIVAKEADFLNLESAVKAKSWEIKVAEDQLTELEKTAKHLHRVIDLTKAQAIADHLNAENERLEGELKAQADLILGKANTYLDSKIRLQAEEAGGLIAPLTLQEMILHFGRDDDEAFLIANPSLEAKNVQEIKQNIRDYLLKKRDQQKCQRLAKSIKEIQYLQKEERNYLGKRHLKPSKKRHQKLLSIQKSIEAERREFMNMYHAKPCLDPNPTPSYLLAFEVIGNILVRPDQFQYLTEIASQQKNVILEARTGFGKSKVLIPLWIYLTSSIDNFPEKKTPMIVCPGPLLRQQVDHLKEILGSTYSTSILEIHMSLEDSQNLKYLTWLNTQLTQAIEKKRCVIANIFTYHHLRDLCFKEDATSPSSPIVKAELEKLKKNLEKLHVFIDEFTDCTDIRHHYDNAHGQQKQVDIKHCQAVGELYETVILPEEGVAFEFLPQTGEAADGPKSPTAVMSEKAYEDTLHDKFIEKVMGLFKVSPGDSPAIAKDLKGHYTEECEEFFSSLNKDQLKKYSIFKQQLLVYLKRSLNRNVGEHYDFSVKENHRFALPLARGKLNEKSEFSTIDDLLNLTIQANLKKPLPIREIEKFFDHMKIASADNPDNEIPFSLCKEIIKQLNFPDVKGIMDIQPRHIPSIQSFLNDPNNRLLKLKFIVNAILPQIQFYEKKLTSNAYDILGATPSLSGASASMVPELLTNKLELKADPKAPVENLISLIEHSKDQIYVVPDSKNSEDKLRHLVTTYTDYNVLIDVDGSFREMAPEEVARIILELRPAIQAVSFYDHQGNNRVLFQGSKVSVSLKECDLPLNQTFTFFPMSSVIGSDPPIALQAKALIPVNRLSKLGFFVQGLGRMRGLQKGQQVGIVVNESDAKIIQELHPDPDSEKLSLQSILRHMTDQEGVQRGKDYFQALRQMFENKLESYLGEKYPDQYKAYIVKKTQVDPLSKLRESIENVPAKQAVQEMVKEITTAALGNILSKEQIEENCHEFLNQIKVDYQFLPSLISLNQGDEAIASVEAVAAAEAAQEASNESHAENIADNLVEAENVEDASKNKLYYIPASEFEWDGNYRKLDRYHLPPYETSPWFPCSSILGERVRKTPNYSRIVATRPIEYPNLRKPSYQYLIIHDPGTDNYEMMLLDLYDAQQILREMRKPKKPSEKNYYLYSGNDPLAKDASTPFPDREWQTNKQLLELSIIRKLYAADSYLTPAEKSFIKLKANQDPAWRELLINEVNQSAKIWPKRMTHLKALINSLLNLSNPQQQESNQSHFVQDEKKFDSDDDEKKE